MLAAWLEIVMLNWLSFKKKKWISQNYFKYYHEILYNIHVPQRMNPNHFNSPLIFLLPTGFEVSTYSVKFLNIYSAQLWTDVHGSQMMNPNNIGGPPWGWPLWFWVKCIWWIVTKFSTDIHAHLRMNCNYFDDPFTFHTVPSSGQHCNFSNALFLMTDFYKIPLKYYVFSGNLAISKC